MNKNIKYCHIEEEKEKSFHFDHVHIFWNEQITYHQSDEWELSYIIRGSGTRVLGDVVETFSSGEVILLPPHMPHGWYFNEYDHDSGGRIENITIIFSPAFISKLANDFPETRERIAVLNSIRQALSFEGKTLKKIQQQLTVMLEQSNIEQLASFLHLLFTITASAETRDVGYFHKRSKATVKMQEISRYMVHNFQRRLSLDEVAKYAGMNRSSFCTFFKREKGKSFFTALNEYRIDCSCQMLRETALPVADICYAVGFEDIPYFNRTFKKIKGVTPNNYRLQHKNRLKSTT